ncbi:MAG TPA: dihydrolipoyl dehydrogenase [Candidatus Hydrogenedentes bacterium]|mgnify:FL=1|nr:dihydrolipoyl dehydrogenase [Candidatus Hydrogenedentota bacterium]
MSQPLKTQVAVIGGGPGGYAAAFAAADLGLEVTLIDLEPNPGGVCLYRGCIPSKALLHCAKVIKDAEEAAQWGIHFERLRIDLAQMREQKDAVVGKLTGGLGQLAKARKIRYMRGRAAYQDSTTLTVTADTGEEQTLVCKQSILAAGSRPTTIPSLLVDSPRMMNSTRALEIEDLPPTLLVVGGGYIGLELGSVYATLGSQVTLVEMTPSFLPGVDEDLRQILSERVGGLFYKKHFNTRVEKIKEVKKGLRVSFRGGDGNAFAETFDKVLLSVGRTPNSSGLGLNTTKVELNDRGFVKVDAQRRTSDPAIFAIGDITGEPMLAHKASHEGRVAAEVIAGHNVAFEPRAIPAVVFTDPELAWCGITETQAKKEGRAINVARFPWGASGRATTLSRPDGLTKLITERDTGQVIGVGIVGTAAGELISQGVLAIEMGATAEDIGLSIHPHPTLSETVMESADMIFGQSIHMYRPKAKKDERA